ncbi:predicted protein [Scheffersomyces stipitis CBS 6054]|uniref:Uncharacterized protein n=1 Tax=Scheffersomyces stipitis (strain ATCC 58785 / CBS 6054 / NBRC 10063 / NRRL Y-11545) TaxID=322104 RepID=A3LUM1_PICST|nr:predicted protein [Scheffersomyces stipitis CBS 6054]ABN66616.1 predicted protein [Scheffersomyces stipitis CBS 6054]
MSDNEETPVVDADTSDNELNKEQRIEAAKKRFEELKKKKAKKSKKKKEKKEGTEETETELDSKENTPAVEIKEEVKDEVEEKEETKEDTKEEIEDGSKEEQETKVDINPEQVELPKEVTGESSVESSSEIAELKATIEQQKNTIKKLRDENTDLKLSKMDLKDKIAELENEIRTLKTGGVPSANNSTNIQPTPRVAVPAKPAITRNDYASISQQSFSKFKHTDDFREKLMVWKGWQVDMTNWSGSGMSQKVAL